jgi:hypothetical protein
VLPLAIRTSLPSTVLRTVCPEGTSKSALIVREPEQLAKNKAEAAKRTLCETHMLIITKGPEFLFMKDINLYIFIA